MDVEAVHRVAVELVIVDDSRQQIVLLQRAEPPLEGGWTLPAGHVEHGEQVYAAARREAREETGLDIAVDALLGLWDTPDRDPRGPVISHGLLCHVTDGELATGPEAAAVAWHPMGAVDELPLDQDEIVAAAREAIQDGTH